MSLPLDTASIAAMPPSDGTCHFDKLPPELLAVVCDMVYGSSLAKGIVLKKTYERDHAELVKKGELASFLPFRHHVDDLLVSKRFFLSAIAASIKVQHLNLIKSGGFRTTLRVTEHVALKAFVRTVQTPSSFSVYLRDFLSLRELEIDVYYFDFEHDPNSIKFPWLHVFQDDELTSVSIVKCLSTLRGLKTFKCKGSDCPYADTQKRKQTWKDNVSALQRYLVPIVTAPKPTFPPLMSRSCTGPSALYPGSRVSGVGMESQLVTHKSKKSGLISEVIGLEFNELYHWVRRALREHPELARPLTNTDLAMSI